MPQTTPAQRRLWFLHRLAADRAGYVHVTGYRLDGPLDTAALRVALTAVVRRHESLRWRFPDRDGQPSVVVDPPGEVALPIADVAEDDRLAEELRAERRHRFDLAREPLWRVRLLRLGARRHALILAAHHIVCDDSSFAIVQRDLATAYTQAVSGAPVLPGAELSGAVPARYSDHVAWLERRYAEHGQSDVDWWVERLAGSSGVLDLPRDRPRPPVQTHDSAEARVRVPDPVAALVHRFAAGLGVPPTVAVLAAFSVLLGRLAGQHDLIVGLLAARRHPDFGGTVGLFTDLVPARIAVADGVDFAGHVRAVDGVITGALDHRDAPFDRIVDRMRLPRDLSRAPLVQVAFEVGHDATNVELPGIVATRLADTSPGSPFDLTLRAVDRAGGLALTAVYNPSLYRPDRIDALLASLVTLLARLSGDPGRPVRAATARPAGPNALPDPTVPLVGDAATVGVVERFRRWAADQPDATAVRSADGTLTYHELDRLRAAVGAAVRGAGVHPGEAVAVLASRSAVLPAVLLGVLGSGARWLLLDPAQPPARLARQAGAAGARLLLACPGTAAPTGLSDVDTIRLEGISGAETDDPGVPPQRRGYLMATSGTTGEPALVRTGEAPLDRFLGWYPERFSLGTGDVTAMLAGLTHDALLRDTLAPLVTGGRVAVPAPELLRDPEGLVGWLAAERVTVLHATPQLARLLARTGGALPRLRLAVLAGDHLTEADAWELRRVAPGAEIVNGYGTTETPQMHAYQTVPPSPSDGRRPHPVPVGVGVPGSQLLVVTPGGTPAAVGELGEVLIRSRNLADGYLDPASRPDNFGFNPITGDPADRVYWTGDLGRYRPDGSVVLAGRLDDQVKVRGYRVELGEVRAALCEHPDVADAVAVARPDGSGETRLTGYAVPLHTGLSTSDLAAHLAQRLPEYARPAALMLLPALPLTPGGKVDRAALPEVPNDRPPTGSPAEPGTPTQRLVAGVWREVLGLPRIGVADNFFGRRY